MLCRNIQTWWGPPRLKSVSSGSCSYLLMEAIPSRSGPGSSGSYTDDFSSSSTLSRNALSRTWFATFGDCTNKKIKTGLVSSKGLLRQLCTVQIIHRFLLWHRQLFQQLCNPLKKHMGHDLWGVHTKTKTKFKQLMTCTMQRIPVLALQVWLFIIYNCSGRNL